MALASLAILEEFPGSDVRAFQYLATAVKDLYWAFLVPLAGLFEGARRMFEKASELRAAYREKIRAKAAEKGRRQGREEGRKEGRKEYGEQLREAYKRFGVERGGVVTLPRTPEVEQFLLSFGNRPYY